MGNKQDDNKRKLKIEKDFKMDVFLCGEHSDVLITQVFGENLKKESDPLLKSPYIKHPTYGWKIFKLSSSESQVKNLKQTIKSFNCANRINNLIVSFVESLSENDKTFVEEFAERKTCQPCILYITKEENPNYAFFGDINYCQKLQIIKFDLTKTVEDNISEISGTLLQFCAYLNQLGDGFEIPIPLSDDDEAIRNKLQVPNYHATLNIILVGRPGSGKSSLINYIMGEKKCREGMGVSVTHYIQKYIHYKYPIAIYDSPGFEGKEEVNSVLKKINQCNDEMESAKEKIQLILYLIDSNSNRTLIGEEIKLVEELLNKNIDIFFLVNMVKSQQTGDEFKEALEISLSQHNLSHLKSNIFQLNLRSGPNNERVFGIKKIYKAIYDKYKTNIIDLSRFDEVPEDDLETLFAISSESSFLDQIKNAKDLVGSARKKAWGIIGGASAVAASVGAIPFGVPGLTSPLLFAIETSMVASLIALYRTSRTKEEVLKGLAVNVTIGGVAFAIGQIPKLIPGIGTAVGIVVSGSVAAGACVSIGASCIAMFEKDLLKDGVKAYLKEMIKCNNKSIKSFLTMSELEVEEEEGLSLISNALDDRLNKMEDKFNIN